MPPYETCRQEVRHKQCWALTARACVFNPRPPARRRLAAAAAGAAAARRLRRRRARGRAARHGPLRAGGAAGGVRPQRGRPRRACQRRERRDSRFNSRLGCDPGFSHVCTRPASSGTLQALRMVGVCQGFPSGVQRLVLRLHVLHASICMHGGARPTNCMGSPPPIPASSSPPIPHRSPPAWPGASAAARWTRRSTSCRTRRTPTPPATRTTGAPPEQRGGCMQPGGTHARGQVHAGRPGRTWACIARRGACMSGFYSVTRWPWRPSCCSWHALHASWHALHDQSQLERQSRGHRAAACQARPGLCCYRQALHCMHQHRLIVTCSTRVALQRCDLGADTPDHHLSSWVQDGGRSYVADNALQHCGELLSRAYGSAVGRKRVSIAVPSSAGAGCLEEGGLRDSEGEETRPRSPAQGGGGRAGGPRVRKPLRTVHSTHASAAHFSGCKALLPLQPRPHSLPAVLLSGKAESSAGRARGALHLRAAGGAQGAARDREAAGRPRGRGGSRGRVRAHSMQPVRKIYHHRICQHTATLLTVGCPAQAGCCARSCPSHAHGTAAPCASPRQSPYPFLAGSRRSSARRTSA